MTDEIVEEVRRYRDEIAREYDYDVEAIVAAMRRLDEADSRPVVSLPPRSPIDVTVKPRDSNPQDEPAAVDTTSRT